MSQVPRFDELGSRGRTWRVKFVFVKANVFEPVFIPVSQRTVSCRILAARRRDGQATRPRTASVIYSFLARHRPNPRRLPARSLGYPATNERLRTVFSLGHFA
jgi:hypothetical protein